MCIWVEFSFKHALTNASRSLAADYRLITLAVGL